MRLTRSRSKEIRGKLQLKLELCKDRSQDPEIGKCLRTALFSLREAERQDVRTLEHMLEAAQDLLEALRQDRVPAARIEAERLKRLTEELQRRKGREKGKMGILKKLFGEKKSQEEIQSQLLGEQIKQAEDYISKIKTQLTRLSDQWDQYYKELNELAQASLKIDRENPRYSQLMAEAKEKSNKMKLLEGQIRQYTSALQNNAQYQTLLANGKITLDLKLLMPDMAKAEALTEEIVRGTESANDAIVELGDILSEGNAKILRSLEQESDFQPDMELFRKLQQKAEKEQQRSDEPDKAPEGSAPQVPDERKQGERKQYEVN